MTRDLKGEKKEGNRIHVACKQKSSITWGKEGMRQVVEKDRKGGDASRGIMNYETV